MTGAQAVEAVELFAEMKRLAETGQALGRRRVEEANAWQASGSRSVREFLATRTGESPGGVGKLVDTARKLEHLGPTGDAVRAGAVSIDQAAAIARAAEVDPASEHDLLDTAKRADLGQLKKAAAAARAAGDPDEQRRYARQRHDRELRTFVDDEGMGNVHWRTTLDEYQRVLSLHATPPGRTRSRPPTGPGDATPTATSPPTPCSASSGRRRRVVTAPHRGVTPACTSTSPTPPSSAVATATG